MSNKLYTEESIKQKLSRMNFFLDEQIEDLIKKAQTPKGNVVVDYLMKEYEKSKIK